MTERASDPRPKFNGWTQAHAQADRPAVEQFVHLAADFRRLAGKNRLRWWSVAFSSSFLAVACYRVERAAYLALGRGFVVLRTVLAPLRLLLRPLRHGCELHYTADIGPGLRIQHPSLGVVVSGKAVLGRNVDLNGGNVITSKHNASGHGDVVLGDTVALGVNAVILGPAHVGTRARIGAGAVVVGDVEAGTSVGGVPARVLRTTTRAVDA